MREIDLSLVLGSDVNQRKLCEFLYVADGADWSEVPVSQARRSSSRNDASPGLTDHEGYLLWFDPYTSEFVDD